eukprot:235686_1
MANNWTCAICDFTNALQSKSCDMCDSNAPNKTKQTSPNQHKQPISTQMTQWQCKECTLLNPINASHCVACTNQRDMHDNPSTNQEHKDSASAESNTNKEQWKCTHCTCSNHIDMPYCETCLTPRSKHHSDNEKQNQSNGQILQSSAYDSPIQSALTNTWEDTNIALQIQTEETQKMKQFYDDLESAKQLEEKYQADDVQFMYDREIALKMQREFAKGLAWFCASCFTMNLNIQSYTCECCRTKRPKPKIPDVLTVRDQVCMKMIEMLRDVAKQQNINCIVNLALAQNFVTKYLEMCKKRGLQLAQPQISYHWTRTQFFDPIKQKGLKVPDGRKVKHATDTGWYGKGIYMSPCPNYAQGYGHGAKQFFVALSLTGKQFPSKYPRDLGIGLKKGYDSHMSSDNVNNQTHRANEWVFFKPEQLLLCFQITLNQVGHITPILNKVNKYLVSKYKDLQKKGGIRGL